MSDQDARTSGQPTQDAEPTTAAARRRKLVVVGLTYPFRGGISYFTTLLVRKLRADNDVRFVTLRRQYPSLLFPGKSQYDYSDKSFDEENDAIIDTLNPLTWFSAARAINRAEPELVVFQWWHPFFGPVFGTIVRLLNRRIRRRVCFLCHNVLPHEKSPLQHLLTLYAFRTADYFIVHSDPDLAQLKELRPTATVAKGRLPANLDFSFSASGDRSAARESLKIDADDNVILFFGLVRAYKGLSYLIDAMPAVLSQISCRLLIVGEFYDDKSKYTSLIEQHSLQEHVQVVDEYVPNEDVPMYFEAANVAVLPYTSATQSGIVPIAFELRTPVITTDVGGLPEAVHHEKTGFVVASESAEELAQAIVRFFSEGLEERFVQQISSEAGRFDWTEEIAAIEHLTEQAGR